ncbi:hypothetical protein BU204_23165 [Actinophytocola xanthii]|uniref:OmpR/PhoB-type domain-containing protein n=1 Tax=Actinophytocola xanthii TaxID=1912961 RepID=A0A1Q8CLJ9_9PSEU|nr:hypothetical protein BU204_23165 [Actinophytocola xanthii]
MLGPFEAWHDGAQVELGDLQQRHALAVLLLHANTPVPGERLIDIIWGENRPKSNLIIGYIAKIRRVFRDAGADDVAILTTPTGYRLELDEDALDTVRFHKLCAGAAAARRRDDPAGATRLLHEAVALWRGDFLDGLDIDRVGGSGVLAPDDALRDAVGDLAELELASGNHRWVRDRLRPLVDKDPTHERLAVLLMRALLGNGDRARALEVYRRTERSMEAYGMTVPPELQSLARQARYGPPRGDLPPRSGRFTGRREELAEIEALAPGRDRAGPAVVWVSGPPGVGKTSLAVEAAHRLRDRFTDARLFVSLNGFTPQVRPTTPTEALGELLAELGVPPEQVPRTLRERAALYQDELAGTRTLVVLDNAGSEEQVRALLPNAPACMAIVTSRRVGDLDVADSLRLDPMPEAEAVELFRSLAGARRLTGWTERVREVVARCGRVPLQITIVASQFRRHPAWPLDHLLRLLGEAGPWNPNGGFDDAGVAAYLVSYQQLEQPQRTLFRLVGHLPGHDLGPEAAAAMLGGEVHRARALLEALYQASLVEESRPERYRMLDPLKSFASCALPPPDPAEHRAALERLLDFYLAATHAAITTAFPFDRDQQPRVDTRHVAAPVFADRRAALDWLGAEWPNLLAAVRHAAKHDHPDHTWRLALLLWRYFHTTARLGEWIETLELAREVTAGDPDNLEGHARVLLRLSTARWRAGELDHALELAAAALPKLIRLGDVRGEADGLCGIALVAIDQGMHRRAMAHFEAALVKYEEIGHRRGQAHALSHLGYLDEMHGELESAERRQLAAIPLLRAIDHRAGLANTLDNLGSVRQRLGRVDQALANHQEARALAVDMGDSVAAAYALTNLANAYRRLGRLDEATRHHELAAAACPEPDPSLRIQLHLDQGATRLARGDLSGALRELRAGLALATEIGDRAQRARADLALARILHSVDDHARAAEHWRSAEAEFDDLELPEGRRLRSELDRLDCACAGDRD